MTISFLAARDPSALLRRIPAVDLIVVGGVPGAGKTTAIAAATAGLTDVVVLDPERLHHAVRDRIPDWVPYRAYRALVHTTHTLHVLWHLLGGPVTGRRLVVHDPGTRRRRRQLFLGLAELRRWHVAAVYVDVDRTAARSGQLNRGRTLRAAEFERHWDRWLRLRPGLDLPAAGPSTTLEFLVDRCQAAAALRWLCLGGDPQYLDVIAVTSLGAAA